MEKTSAYTAYCLFLSIKNHFKTKSYNFFKYKSKTRTSLERFEKRKDRWQFNRLGSLYNEDDLVDFLVANILEDKLWVGDFLEDDAKHNYEQYKKRRQSLTYHFENELIYLFEKVKDNPKELTCTKGNQYPLLLTEFLNKKISIDTLVILDKFLCFSQKFDSTLGDDFIWTSIKMKIVKYEPFMEYDKERMKKVLKNNIYILDTK
jgi:hypothetical protein